MIIKKGDKTYVPLRVTFRKSDEARNNKATFVLPISYYDEFHIDDDINIYTSDNQLLTNAYVVNKTLTVDATNPTLVISAFDKESLMFNRNWSEIFTNTEAPIIIGSVLSKVTNDIRGVHLSRVNIKFVGYPRTDGIQVTTTNHPEIEFTIEDIANNTQAYQDYVNLPSSDKFQSISSFGANFKPVYEWVKELSQPKNTGLEKTFVWYLDENNVFRWYRVDSPAETEKYLYVDYQLTKKQDDKVNFIIAYLGNDLNDNPIYIYAYKDYSGTPNVQESIKDWGDIARDLRDAYSDNTAFREAVREKGLARARAYFESETMGRIRGTFTIPKYEHRLGEVLKISHHYGSDSYKVVIKGLSLTYDTKKGPRYTYDFEEVIE